jgi:hypothetical protein
MRELLLNTIGVGPVPPVELTKAIFNLGSSTTLPAFTLDFGAGVTYESTPSIDGVTMAGSLGSVDANITFATPIDLYSTDWTLEYSAAVTGADTGQTIAELSFADTLSNLALFYTRFSDTTHFNRFAVIGANSAAGIYCTDKTRTVMSTLHRVALVKIAGEIYVYYNGVRQNLAQDKSTTYDRSSVPANAALLQTVKYINLGRNALTAFVGSNYTLKMGPVRFTGRPLYTGNYTPVPF